MITGVASAPATRPHVRRSPAAIASLVLLLAGCGQAGHTVRPQTATGSSGQAAPVAPGELVATLSSECRQQLDRALDPSAYAAVADRCAEAIGDWNARVAGLEHRLADAARRAAPVARPAVDCPDGSDWRALAQRYGGTDSVVLAGLVLADDRRIRLGPATCLALDELAAAPGSLRCLGDPRAFCHADAVEGAIAVVTLAHEAQHAAGETNEAAAQCRALQVADDVAGALGVPARDAARIGAFVRHALQQPPEYRSPDCRPAGRLDLEPQTPAFP
jgi:hypothetical protein